MSLLPVVVFGDFTVDRVKWGNTGSWYERDHKQKNCNKLLKHWVIGIC